MGFYAPASEVISERAHRSRDTKCSEQEALGMNLDGEFRKFSCMVLATCLA